MSNTRFQQQKYRTKDSDFIVVGDKKNTKNAQISQANSKTSLKQVNQITGENIESNVLDKDFKLWILLNSFDRNKGRVEFKIRNLVGSILKTNVKQENKGYFYHLENNLKKEIFQYTENSCIWVFELTVQGSKLQKNIIEFVEFKMKSAEIYFYESQQEAKQQLKDIMNKNIKKNVANNTNNKNEKYQQQLRRNNFSKKYEKSDENIGKDDDIADSSSSSSSSSSIIIKNSKKNTQKFIEKNIEKQNSQQKLQQYQDNDYNIACFVNDKREQLSQLIQTPKNEKYSNESIQSSVSFMESEVKRSVEKKNFQSAENLEFSADVKINQQQWDNDDKKEEVILNKFEIFGKKDFSGGELQDKQQNGFVEVFTDFMQNLNSSDSNTNSENSNNNISQNVLEFKDLDVEVQYIQQKKYENQQLENEIQELEKQKYDLIFSNTTIEKDIENYQQNVSSLQQFQQQQFQEKINLQKQQQQYQNFNFSSNQNIDDNNNKNNQSGLDLNSPQFLSDITNTNNNNNENQSKSLFKGQLNFQSQPFVPQLYDSNQ